jgi:hypothetical protein
MAYPDAIKYWVRRQNRQDLVVAEDVNTIYDEVENIEKHLGQGGVTTSDAWNGANALVKSTTWTSLKTRLQNIENGLFFAHDQRVKTTGGSTVTPSSAAVTGVVVAGASGQTADLLRVESSSGTSFLKVSGSGAVTITIDGGTA